MNRKSPSAIQSIAWETGLEVIRESEQFSSFDALIEYLKHGVRLNSQATRERYANLLVKRLFPEKSLDGLNPRTWRTYHDEQLLCDLARFTTLEAEPVIARFVVEQLLAVPAGSLIDAATLRDFVGSTYGSFKKDSAERIQSAIQHMGFVTRIGGKLVTQDVARPATALLILLHARLAPTPRIVRLSDILETQEGNAPFWKLLGIREEKTVRSILREAADARLIAKYTLVDQLEQITTGYSLDEYLEKRLHL